MKTNFQKAFGLEPTIGLKIGQNFKELLVRKVKIEYNEFINEVIAEQLEHPASTATLDRAYEIVGKQLIVEVLHKHWSYLRNMSEDEAKILWCVDDTLEYLYEEYFNADKNEMEDVADAITGAAQDIKSDMEQEAAEKAEQEAKQ